MIPYHQMRSALHLVVYIRELGAEPPPLRDLKYERWAARVHRRFDQLKKSKGATATKVALLRGRELIMEKGLLAVAADSLPPPKSGAHQRCLICRKWTWATMEEAMAARACLRRAPNVRSPALLGIYPCPRGPGWGWHIGHHHQWSGGSLCIGEHK